METSGGFLQNGAKVKMKSIMMDVQENALDSLEMAAKFLSHQDIAHQWKWVSIALLNALYGFCISVIKETDPNGVIKKEKCTNKECEKRYDPYKAFLSKICPNCKKPLDIKLEDIRLIGFSEAFKQIQKNDLMLSDSQKRSIEKLHKDYRNNFEHFNPNMFWGYSKRNPKIVLDVIDVIEKLSSKLEGFTRYPEKEKAIRFWNTIKSIRQYGQN
jgi:hypothetical protein